MGNSVINSDSFVRLFPEYFREIFTASIVKRDGVARCRSQLAQGCVRFARLSVTVKVSNGYAFHYHSDHAARSSSGRCFRTREGSTTILDPLRCGGKNSKIDISVFREFEEESRNAVSFWESRERERDSFSFRTKEKESRISWQKLIRFIVRIN